MKVNPFIQYFRFAIVGGGVAAFTIAAREIIELILPSTSASFNASIILAWVLGTVVSYQVQRKVTFGNESAHLGQFARFCFVSTLAGGFCVIATNAALFTLSAIFSHPIAAHTFAFVIGNLLASVVSFGLYRTLVFGKTSRQK